MKQRDLLEEMLQNYYPKAIEGKLDKSSFHFMAEQVIEHFPGSDFLPEMFQINETFGYDLENNQNIYKWAFMNVNPIAYDLVEKYMSVKPVDEAVHAAISHYVPSGVFYLAKIYPDIVFSEKNLVKALNYCIASMHEEKIVQFYLDNLERVADLGHFTLDKLRDFGDDRFLPIIQAYQQVKHLQNLLPEKKAGLKMKI